jgi:hypothetical protein
MTPEGSICAACGMPGHRYGRNEGMERFNPQACINGLLGRLEEMRTLKGFTECQECDDGIDLSDDGYPTGLPCPDCGGSGQVPDPETVEVVARALMIERYGPGAWERFGYSVQNIYRREASAALLAYARQLKPEKENV